MPTLIRAALQRVLHGLSACLRWVVALSLVAAPGGLAWLFYAAAPPGAQIGAAEWIGIGFIVLLLVVFQAIFTLLAGAITGIVRGTDLPEGTALPTDGCGAAAAAAALTVVVAMDASSVCN